MKNLALRKVKDIGLVLLVVAALMALIGAPYTKDVLAVGGEPESGTLVGLKVVTFADGTTPLAATTYYGGSGSGSTSATLAGLDAMYWHSADIFVTADVSGTNTLTVIAQWSADNSNWVDAYYTEHGWYTSTLYSSNVAYSVAIAADGSDVMSIPVKGRYLRLKAQVGSAVNITPTMYIVLKNDGGH
ncbi:MAG: hypothetical protein JXA14_22860 [Anaerolineae bacterium]|nr:hypothetical protein [Anaerolineae bacterium]